LTATTLAHESAQLHLQRYHRAELRNSDHRPVYAVFDATVREVDHAKKDAIQKELVKSLRKGLGEGNVDLKIEKAADAGLEELVKRMTTGG
jgi:hypothetical protein